MLLQCCISCKFHIINIEDDRETSFCSKENCWARYSRCVAQKALEHFIRNELVRAERTFTALELLYSGEE